MPALTSIASIPIASGPTLIYSAPVTVRPSACFGYTTAGDVATRALKLILVEGADSDLEPDEYADALDLMNSFMAGLESDGVRLGYSRVCNIVDIVTIPDGAIRGLAANLALDLAPLFGGKISAALVKQADEGLKTLYKLGVHVGEARYPPSLPGGNCRGYGRSGDSGFYGSSYQSPAAQMTLAGNRRVTEISVAAGAEKVQGFWTVGRFHGLAPDISGRITNRGEKQTVTVAAELTIVSDADIPQAVIAITRNAQIVLYVNAALSTDPSIVQINGSIELEPGEYLDIVVGDVYTTTNITVTDGTVCLT